MFFFLLLVGLACLFPLSLYCLFLALLHQRRRVTHLSGTWDFAAVLAALSGFLLFGGTTLLLAVNSVAHDALLRGNGLADLQYGYSRIGVFTFILWGLYGLLLVGGSALMLWKRADSDVFYNLAPAELEQVVSDLCARSQLPLRRSGTRYYLGFGSPEKTEQQRKVILEMDGSSAMRQVTLRWVLGRADVAGNLKRI